MPLSEFHQAARAKLDSNQSKVNNSSSDRPSSVLDSEFMELLWENGQIVMQGQSNRPRKSSIPTLSFHPTKLQEKEGRDCVLPKISRFGAMDSVANDFSTAGISGQTGPNIQDDDMVPWPNYPIDDYCLEFLSEFSGNNTNNLPLHTTSMAADKGSNSLSQLLRDSHSLDQNVSPKALNGSSDPGRIRNVQFNQMPQQWPSSVLNSKSRTLDFAAGNTTTSVAQNSTWDLPDVKMQMQEPVSPQPPPPPPPSSTGSPGYVNFSHFTRPVALLKANLQSTDRLKSNGKASTTASTDPMESTLIEPSGGFKSISQGQLAVVAGKGEIKSTSQPQPELVSVNHSEAMNCEDASRDKNIGTYKNRRSSEHVHSQGLAFMANLPGLKHDLDKKSETVAASSSVCSASGACTTSSDPKHGVKRKIQEGEESGYQSEDLEDESTGVKKTATARGTTAKRSRAAAVHNLSERRRRDRINEKMRTLQELIPNCNKVDKASMLDEAIEYLKTLQLQLQIMSMGSGLCMPPMMLPPGMQHLRAPHMAHFPPMGVGMGMGMNMGMGFGMGMLDMNGSPMIPMPPMHRPQFPCSIPGNPGMPGIAGSSSLQMVGIPRQGHPVPLTSGSPFVPLPVHSTSANTMPEALGMPTSPIKATELAPFASLKDHQIQKSNSEAGHKVEPDDSHIPTSTQATKECLEESSNVQIKDHASHSSDGHINSTSGKGNSSTGTSCSFECAC